jgi:hypothetical protein
MESHITDIELSDYAAASALHVGGRHTSDLQRQFRSICSNLFEMITFRNHKSSSGFVITGRKLTEQESMNSPPAATGTGVVLESALSRPGISPCSWHSYLPRAVIAGDGARS